MQKQTTVIKPSDINRKWYVVDATDIPLGRLASKVSMILTGKAKPTYQPNIDTGDFVIIVNAQKVLLTGNKINNKKYYNVSGYLGGLRTRTARVMKESYPVEMVERAVWGMLPKGPLGRKMYKKLKVYAGAEHKNQAQQPEVLEIK
ncbi:MAG: 50S ribosomal protein L13 [Bacilli bacterium]|jgi:large subunit ribosomal protein L13|nr:50S ribosomal protein L13 [Bacilli bacterium]